jgi:two-component system phosphate regulon sensor histidine kinase PhoR
MIDLVNALLSVSRIELGNFTIEPVKLDIATIVDDVLRELRAQIKKKGLTVTKKYQKNIPNIMSDKNLARIIFQNLLTNAVTYTPANGKIFVRIKKTDSGVNIAVEDNGCGIPEVAQPKIYTKFFRADNARILKSDGNGLGLYMTKSIVETLGGTISFKSKNGKGATFYVTLYNKGIAKRKLGKELLA